MKLEDLQRGTVTSAKKNPKKKELNRKKDISINYDQNDECDQNLRVSKESDPNLRLKIAEPDLINSSYST